MTMEMAHEAGCDQRHTRRQWCNGPVADESRRLAALERQAFVVTQSKAEYRRAFDSPILRIPREEVAWTAADELLPYAAFPLVFAVALTTLAGAPGALVWIVFVCAYSLSGCGWIRAGYVATGVSILALRLAFVSIPFVWKLFGDIEINIDSGPSEDEGTLTMWFFATLGWPVVSWIWLLATLRDVGRHASEN